MYLNYLECGGGTPQGSVAKRLGAIQRTISNCLGKMAELPNLLKADLSKGLTLSLVAEKHGGSLVRGGQIFILDKRTFVKNKDLTPSLCSFGFAPALVFYVERIT